MDSGEFGVWVALGLPIAERLNDRETDYENAGADEDLRAAVGCLGTRIAWRGERENEREREQGVVEPVSLGVDRERE